MRIALAALGLAAATTAQDFPLPLHRIEGKDPRAVVVADFDLDGHPDFASAQFVTDEIAIVLAEPGGDYEPPILLEVGNGYTDIGVGDFDLDGRPDLVATNQLDPWLRIFDNDGRWTWCGAQGAVVANALAVGDMDGDGRPDVVVADSFTNQAQVVITAPSGCPAAPVGYATGTKPVDVAVADFDGDGALDVVTCNETAATLSLLRGDGSGGLLPATSVAVGSTPTALAAADLDQDGDVDVDKGTLQLGADGVDPHTGTFDVADGAALRWSAGTHVLTPAGRLARKGATGTATA
ncbi:MAG TPA: VCBS repeat-containing protein, partial [Ilumatobacteraceae bacterium]|nr:VCBS repeat-containing protein [Ilumatobacteraceae bacterium]